jgi:hypothetical protein
VTPGITRIGDIAFTRRIAEPGVLLEHLRGRVGVGVSPKTTSIILRSRLGDVADPTDAIRRGHSPKEQGREEDFLTEAAHVESPAP